jgi:hypothetical protein
MTAPITSGAGSLPPADERSCSAVTPGDTKVGQLPKILAMARNEPELER